MKESNSISQRGEKKMQKEKKKWETPKLICLYRGRPEEAVLAVCKGTTGSIKGPPDKNCSAVSCLDISAT